MRSSLVVGKALEDRISYLRAGDPAGTCLVLVHGTPGSATGWADYLTAPPEGADVVALDRPGFGASAPNGAVPSLAAQAAAVVALLPTDQRPVVLLGHSLGAPIVAWAAAQLAAEQPARPVAIVMLAGSLDPAQESIHAMQHIGAWKPVQWLLPRTIRNANAELMALKPELEALGKILPSVKAKVLIVHGTADDLVPVANVAYMQERFSGARCITTVLLEGQNHFLPWNSEGAVREALRIALQRSC
jgi:pimeloyl-ACP methyl ester carboxylesterase